MKRNCIVFLLSMFALLAQAQGWPANYQGVMLQGFYWDSFSDSQWSYLESRADEFKDYFKLVWIPQSANCGGGQSMGYDDLYWFSNYNSSFGNETELRSLINTYKQKGIGTIADVVINHRKDVKDWVVFPTETYKGQTYQLVSTDVCANDDGGKTKTEAAKLGYQLSKNNDSGEDWSGMRDLDHASENVQKNVHAYLDFLQNDLGYIGFRYDMVKGYAAKYTGLYNSTAKPVYSVGEYWDGNVATVQNWLNGTKVGGEIQSAVFDFPFRYTVRDAIRDNDWSKLAGASLVSGSSAYKRYSVTFVENHDTEYRSSTEQQDPIRRDTLAANAFMLAMPGTPCVFYKHWIDCRQDIAKMIKVRNAVGISNESQTVAMGSNKQHFVHKATGANATLLCVVGSDAATYKPNGTWFLAASGYHWAYYTDKPVDIGDVTFPEEKFDAYDITVHVCVDKVGWQKVNFWTWGGDGTHAPANKNWPGDAVAATKTIAGRTWYHKTYTIGSVRDCVNFVFSTGTGSPQTVDITNIKHDAYLEVLPDKDGTKHLVADITESTGIEAVRNSLPKRQSSAYNIQGIRVNSKYKGFVIKDGKKYITTHRE